MAQIPLVGVCAFALALGEPAQAAPRLVVQAQVSDDLRTVTGTLRGEIDPSWTWVDPLAEMPLPDGDRDRMRTLPGRPDRGEVTWDPSTGAFTAHLPRRFTALGTTRHGLYANGGWLPVLRDAAGLVIADWEVEVTLPEDVVGAVGGAVGRDVVHWEGTGERVPLAVVPRGEVTEIAAGGVSLTVLSRGKPPKRILRGLEATAAQLDPLAVHQAVVIVAPLRSRLARPGPGAVFVSDDAWRMTPGLRRFHDTPVREGVAQALIDLPPFERALVAEVVSAQGRKDMDEALAGVSWIPLVDQTLNDRSMPYATEVLEDPIPDHPVVDDLVERFDPHWPAGAVVVQLDLVHGEGTASAVAEQLLAGEPVAPEHAAHLQSLRGPPPVQDLTLDVDTETVVVHREGHADGTGQAIPLVIGDETHTWQLEDPEEASFPRSPGQRVALDPDRVVPQTSRLGETYPAKLKATVTGSAGNISLAPLALDGFVTVNLRRADDSRTVWSPGVFFGDQVLAEGRLSVLQMAGRPLDALRREHQFSLGPSVLWLDPRYASDSTSGAGLALRAGYTWDTKGESLFPLQGHTLSAAAEAGTLLTSPDRWTRFDLRAAGVVAPHPWLAIALQLTGARSDSPFAHKALDLGSLDGLLSVPIGTVTGRTRGTGRLELRGVPVRYADVPLVLLWGTELQLSAGVEAGVLESEEGRYAAIGASGGLGLVFDWAGAKPSMTGISAGWLVWTDGFEVDPTPWPQIVVRSDQWF